MKKIELPSLFSKKTYIIFSISFAFFCLLLILFNYTVIKARSSDDCLVCHEDKELSMNLNGKKTSLYVNAKGFRSSVHAGFDCKDCHEGYNPDNIPHSTKKNDLKCQNCHENIKSSPDNVHKNQKCGICHTTHEVRPKKEIEKTQFENCLNCHKNKNVQSYKNSIHDKKDVKCQSCHDSGHNIKKIAKTEISNTCGKCHSSHQKDFNNSIHQTVFRSGNTKAPTCVDCHGAHQIIGAKINIESQSCLKCHLDESLFPGNEKGSAKFVAEYKTSIHSSIQKNGNPAAGCSDCHGNHTIQNPGDPNSSLAKDKILESCNKCHSSEVSNYKTSAHGKAYANKNKDAPSCLSCHGEHGIKSVLKSDEFSKLNQTEMCLNCHKEGKVTTSAGKEKQLHIDDYKQSVHYLALKEGKLNAATCSNCHGAHEMKNYKDPTSKINIKNVENTCGQSECHSKQAAEYNGSIHQVSIMNKDKSDAPSCVTCHGLHQVLKKDDVNNRIASSKGVVQLCSDCHNSVELVKKYKLPIGRTDSYMNSFHGLAVRGGSKVAANCESCHGYHYIRPSSDSLSTVFKKNLPVTC